MMKGFNGMDKYDFDYDHLETFSVSFEMNKGTDRRYVFEGTYEEDVPWSMIMQRFVEFLEGTGYIGVREKVSIEDSPFLDGYWFGPVHDSEAMSVAKDVEAAAQSVFEDDEDDWK
jgi:hypothetical protein